MYCHSTEMSNVCTHGNSITKLKLYVSYKIISLIRIFTIDIFHVRYTCQRQTHVSTSDTRVHVSDMCARLTLPCHLVGCSVVHSSVAVPCGAPASTFGPLPAPSGDAARHSWFARRRYKRGVRRYYRA